jgi:hypothetical protein
MRLLKAFFSELNGSECRLSEKQLLPLKAIGRSLPIPAICGNPLPLFRQNGYGISETCHYTNSRKATVYAFGLPADEQRSTYQLLAFTDCKKITNLLIFHTMHEFPF